MKRTSLIETMERKLETAKTAVAEFAEELAGDPLYAMSWGENPLQAAAEVSIITPFLTALLEGVEVATLYCQLEREILNAARYPERSTSQMHNLAAQAGNVVRAELHKQFRNVEEN